MPNIDLQKYNKFLVAFVGLLLLALAPYYGANPTFQHVVSVATLLGIFHVPNKQ